ncbi:phage protease [Sphingomonas sp. CROZ-RG-20F-R02-07]|uniref:phage protease n=1 Tax=Sphingomonas sp. CROZ-RG-20F-R02-07 TaxID=2914832 RepID=UPI001F56573E|nr:phage protease [Sphingomonas sp. CROZ-RG-20F-R02-07]
MSTALCAAITIETNGGAAPEWLHLLPAGEARTVDGRGPYRVADTAALMAASLAAGKLTLDENHATDLAAPNGGAAPARGWIVDLQSRADGIWGKVDWVDAAGGTPVWKQYRGVSPVIAHDKTGTVSAILRASLTNTPNLAGLVTLHSQEKTNMDFRKLLLGLLGLDDSADDAAITAAMEAMKKTVAQPDAAVALQAAFKPIAAVLGLPEGADAVALLSSVKTLKAGGDDRVVALQSEVATLTTRLDASTTDRARDKATAFVDAAIGAGRVGLRPVRAEYISMHMADPAQAEKLVNAMPTLAPGASTLTVVPHEGAPENPALLAQKAGAYQAKQAAAGITIDFATAVRAVSEGKAA